jgi:hypothetical protein
MILFVSGKKRLDAVANLSQFPVFRISLRLQSTSAYKNLNMLRDYFAPFVSAW